MNEFTTIFDLTSKSVRADAIYNLIISITLIACGLAGAVFHQWVTEKIQIRITRSVFVIMALAGCGWYLWHMELSNYAIWGKAKDAQVVEGIVHVSHEQPYHGHSSGDKITIDGQPFVIDYFYTTAGYKDTISHGGALRAGVYARIHHCDGTIIKVEIMK
jgi:hypothetical protein